jgi:hypothetical protein
VNDDWRLSISFDEEAHARGLGEHLQARELEHGLEDSFDERVIVSRNGAELFCYAGTRDQAERAESLVRSLAGEHDWAVTTTLRRWHPDAEAWEDPGKALPATDAERQEEHDELIARERSEGAESGHPEWEVRVDCPSHRDAVGFARSLEGEGMRPVRRWKYLIIGASDEDSARQLADRLQAEAPEGSKVAAEGTWQEAQQGSPPNPFAFLGGLGGS